MNWLTDVVPHPEVWTDIIVTVFVFTLGWLSGILPVIAYKSGRRVVIPTPDEDASTIDKKPPSL